MMIKMMMMMMKQIKMTKHTHAYIRQETIENKKRKEDELLINCKNVNAQDLNLYAHIKKKEKKSVVVVKAYM